MTETERRKKLSSEKSKLLGEISFIRQERRSIKIPTRNIAFQFNNFTGTKRMAIQRKIREDKRRKRNLDNKIERRRRRIEKIDIELESGLL